MYCSPKCIWVSVRHLILSFIAEGTFAIIHQHKLEYSNNHKTYLGIDHAEIPMILVSILISMSCTLHLPGLVFITQDIETSLPVVLSLAAWDSVRKEHHIRGRNVTPAERSPFCTCHAEISWRISSDQHVQGPHKSYFSAWCWDKTPQHYF